MTTVSLHGEIRSHLAEIDPVCSKIRSLLEKSGLKKNCFAVELVARECLNNAIIHGNGLDMQKKVAIHLGVGRKWICLQVSDEGPGFNWKKARKAPGPDDTAFSGRGLSIGALYAYRMTFNPRGNRVTLWLKREKEGGSNRHGRLHH